MRHEKVCRLSRLSSEYVGKERRKEEINMMSVVQSNVLREVYKNGVEWRVSVRKREEKDWVDQIPMNDGWMDGWMDEIIEISFLCEPFFLLLSAVSNPILWVGSAGRGTLPPVDCFRTGQDTGGHPRHPPPRAVLGTRTSLDNVRQCIYSNSTTVLHIAVGAANLVAPTGVTCQSKHVLPFLW